MTMSSVEKKHQRELQLVEDVDNLSEEIRMLALNLAIYLAKVKAQASSEELNRMEPEFIKLVNGTVKVVQEMTLILNAARNQERMIYDPPSSSVGPDRIETRLKEILDQCGNILGNLNEGKDFKV
jgi:hypothetical protein